MWEDGVILQIVVIPYIKADIDCKVRVAVSDNFATKAPFRMIIREPKPDFDLLVSASAPAGDNNKGKKIVREGIAVRRGQVGNLDVYVLRRDGFDGEIELKAQGFPESFKVKTTKEKITALYHFIIRKMLRPGQVK